MATHLKPGQDGSITISTDTGEPAQVAAVSNNGAPTPTERMFTADELEAARRQEKDKLYPRLQTLEEQLQTFQTEREATLKTAQEAAAAADNERRLREEAEMSAKDLIAKREEQFNSHLTTVQQEWQTKLTELEQRSAAQEAMLEQERRFQSLEAYKQRRVQEEQDRLMPELLDFIRGNTEEEIDNSISTIAERTSAIVGNIQQSMANQGPPRLRGIPPTGSSPTGPLENSSEQTFSAQDIANLSMEEYAQLRGRLHTAASNNRRR